MDDEPIVTHRSQVERPEIEKLIDLANTKLLARYTESFRLTQPVKPAQPPRAAVSLWSAKGADF